MLIISVFDDRILSESFGVCVNNWFLYKRGDRKERHLAFSSLGSEGDAMKLHKMMAFFRDDTIGI